MSGDVQPRKRKDKKRKREDEPREQHQGVHGSKMGNEDVHLHVQGDHETGGHWCAKLFFFSLLVILLGLIGLIILENRGLADLDTPLSESRFSNYFDGWVDEHREAHDEHDAVTASIEEHEHGDEPFEEEEDHSEVDETEEDDEEHDHDVESEGDGEHEEDEEETKENEEETEELDADTEEEAGDETQEDDEEENDDENTLETQTEETREDDDDEDVDKKDDENEDEDEEPQNGNDEDEDEEEDTVEEIEPPKVRSHQSSQQSSYAQSKTKEEDNDDDDDDEPFEEEDDDGTFESLESVVDNDGEELLLLQEKARQQQASLKKDEPEPEEEPSSYASPLAVKIGVGMALALVARLVLVRKSPNTNEPSAEDLMKRRLTIAEPGDTFIEDNDELLEYEITEEDKAMNRELSDEEEYIDEEIIEEEEIEVTDEEYEEDKIEELRYKPQTFEQFNALYRPKINQEPKIEEENTKKISPPKTVKIQDYSQRMEQQQQQQPVVASKPSQSRFAHYHREKTPPPGSPSPPPFQQPPLDVDMELRNSQAYSDEHEDDIEYDDEELYDDEMLDEEEEDEEIIADDEEDEGDLSDVDDSDLMSRLEAKYGRLPAKEFDSDEDVEDQTWTKIKPRGGGPQLMDDDEFEEELKKANEEMLRENLNPALTLFDSLSRKFPDKPEVFIGKAKVLDKMAETLRSNSRLSQALDAYKRYLAFGEEILNDLEFVEVAQRCVDRMRFMGLHLQAVSIHEMLIERFPNEVSHRNQLAVTYLMVNRLSDAKQALEEILARWPDDGYAMVHYGFVLKSLNQNLNLAAEYLRRGIDSQQKGTQDGRFYYNLGDVLQRLGRLEEARDIYRRGAALKLFPSEYQRSLYNVNSLRAQPFWSKTETNYEQFLNRIEENWQAIRDEGLSVLNAKGVFEDETENLRDTGDWKQLELFSRGQRRQKNCLKAPITCGIIETFPSARFCKRGQVKFSVMHPGTHVWPHCGPTNCRLRAHLGLKVPPGTVLRVAEEKRTWEEGKFLIFDDSFEHEVWHNGNNLRLVLIVDVWHPDLTEQQRQSLSPI